MHGHAVKIFVVSYLMTSITAEAVRSFFLGVQEPAPRVESNENAREKKKIFSDESFRGDISTELCIIKNQAM